MYVEEQKWEEKLIIYLRNEEELYLVWIPLGKSKKQQCCGLYREVDLYKLLSSQLVCDSPLWRFKLCYSRILWAVMVVIEVGGRVGILCWIRFPFFSSISCALIAIPFSCKWFSLFLCFFMFVIGPCWASLCLQLISFVFSWASPVSLMKTVSSCPKKKLHERWSLKWDIDIMGVSNSKAMWDIDRHQF